MENRRAIDNLYEDMLVKFGFDYTFKESRKMLMTAKMINLLEEIREMLKEKNK